MQQQRNIFAGMLPVLGLVFSLLGAAADAQITWTRVRLCEHHYFVGQCHTLEPLSTACKIVPKPIYRKVFFPPSPPPPGARDRTLMKIGLELQGHHRVLQVLPVRGGPALAWCERGSG
jgi:hypothetical protein